MREIFDHRTNPAHEGVVITAVDEPGAGGACNQYRISGPVVEGGLFFSSGAEVIKFQNGTVGEHGLNGLTHEILLAIVIDRLRSFQDGPFACRENALALTKLEEAMNWLHSRSKNRIRRGVEGKSEA